ncbi:MAG: hypothetical protein FJX23_06110, partial [Alphaproteobacteria bacterium]|nr:hypothetical protein [Alphaproteobacteria bacterium]
MASETCSAAAYLCLLHLRLMVAMALVICPSSVISSDDVRKHRRGGSPACAASADAYFLPNPFQVILMENTATFPMDLPKPVMTALESNSESLLDAARDIPLVLPRKDFASVLLASFSANVLALALPLMTLQVYDRILVNGGLSTLAVLGFGVVVAVLAEWMVRVARSYLMGMAGAQFEQMASEEALRRILSADLKRSGSQSAGQYLEGLSAIGRMRDFYAGHLVSSFVDMPFMVIYLALIAYLAGSVVWVPMLLLVLFSMIIWVMGRHMRTLVRQREESDSHRYGRVIEMLSGLHSVKALGLEAKMQRLYERLLIQGSASDYTLSMTNGMANMLGGFMSQIMMVAVVVAGAPLVINGSISMGSLIACLLLAGRLTQPLMRALSLWAHFQEVRLAREQVAALYALPKRYTDRRNATPFDSKPLAGGRRDYDKMNDARGEVSMKN